MVYIIYCDMFQSTNAQLMRTKLQAHQEGCGTWLFLHRRPIYLNENL
jgi:hypothetical protein